MKDRVLLVEGDELLGILFELALVEAGYAVTRARSGLEALAKLEVEGPSLDAVITDVAIGEGPNGWQVARRARAMSQSMPVLYMTGGRADEWAPQHVPFGVLLLKPFPVTQMVDMVGRLIAASHEGARRSA